MKSTKVAEDDSIKADLAHHEDTADNGPSEPLSTTQPDVEEQQQLWKSSLWIELLTAWSKLYFRLNTIVPHSIDGFKLN